MGAEPILPARRIALVLLGFLLLYLLVLMRMFYIQIIRASEFQALARRQYEAKITLQPQRGPIYDRNGRVIATTVRSISYAVDARMLRNRQAIAQALALATGDSLEYWSRKVNNAKGSFTWLARGLLAHHPALDTLQDPGLLRINEPRRSYVYGGAGAQVIGLTNIDNKGLAGIELMLDSVLRGKSGTVIMQRDGLGNLRPTVDVPITPALNGKAVQLTLDMELQRIAEFELAAGIEEAQAEGGTVIAIEPSTGEIMAMASYPGFDPNHPGTARPEATRLQGITDMYEPGSTFKLITAAAALEEKIISAEDTVDGMGGMLKIADYEIKDSHPLGRIPFKVALEQSSNIVFAQLSRRIPDDKFYKYARDFGFGILLGIDLPGEVPGLMKKPREFDATTKNFMAFGYQLGATALQMASAYATLANKGVMMRPYVVKAVYTMAEQDKEAVFTAAPQTIRRVISEESATKLTDMLCGVVDQGTGIEARIPGIRIAGKTGTAQQLVDGAYSRQAYTASFAGFFPADNPRIAMLVMLHRPQTDIYGGKTAAPIFRKIAQKWITASQLDFEHTDEDLIRTRALDSALVPDIRGMAVEKARLILLAAGLRPSGSSHGTVFLQDPPAGGWAWKGSTVTISAKLMYAPPQATLQDTISQSAKKLQSDPNRPDVKGMTIRRALALLHAAGISVKVNGHGKVKEQIWGKTRKKECIIYCE